MSIGFKIKRLRIKQGLTQEQLSGDKITRNMLSIIESEKATPSLDTLYYLAERLSVPVSYLISDDEDLYFYEKNDKINNIKKLYKENKFEECIKVAESLSKSDDEIAMVLANCYFQCGKNAVTSGFLLKGKALLQKSLDYSKSTVYFTSLIEAESYLYLAIAENIQSPLLEFNESDYLKKINSSYDVEFYNYLIQNKDFSYTTKSFSNHLNCKELIKSRRYSEAVSILKVIEEEKRNNRYNAYLIFSVYTDLEACYKQLGDYENAYRYASKRLTLLDAFKS